MQLDIDKLRELLELLEQKKIAEFEHEDEKVRFRVTRYHPASSVSMGPPAAYDVGAAPTAGSGSGAGSDAGALAAAAELIDSVDVTSPFVGTFYRSPSPDTPSFVDIGSVVRPGQTLCIIEAMKLMNEIEAESSGTVIEVFAQNGKAVEFGQKLFRIKKA